MILKRLDHKKSKAQAMVEFAIALPVLLALLYGIIEAGRLMFMYSTVVNASRQAVRYASTTGTGNGTGYSSEPRYQDCDGIRSNAQKAGYIGAFDTVDLKYDSPGVIALTPYCTNTSALTDGTFIPTGNNYRVTVTVAKQFTPLIPKLVPFIARNITATSSRTILTGISIYVSPVAPILETTTTTITSDNPDPSNVGEAVTVVVSVTSTTTPTGTVTITSSDPASTTCTITLPATSCTMIFNTGGPWVITASYGGDTTHATSSGTTAHAVKYSTATTITAHIPDPSTTNQAVAVTVTVASGLAIPNGTVVNITGANTNCSVTLTNGTGSCNVVFTTTGTKTLTASYTGDANHSASSSTAIHDVLVNNDTVTRITSVAPEPSIINQAVTVSVKVVGLTPLTGTVAIIGADTNCTITLSGGTGSCSVVNFTTAGGKSITATYTGDHNTSSTSQGHIVNLPATTTTITAHTPDPSTPGQTVSVTISVTGGASAPTGTVTITGADAPCTITLPAASCNVVFSAAGTKTLSAVYNGDSTHAASNSTATHTVAAPVVSPVPSCNSVTHGLISLSGNTMTMTITNPYVFPLTTGVGTVTWNDDKGHQTGSDKSLSLQSIVIGTTTIWTGSSDSVSTVPFTNPAVIPANTTVTITFTFQQSYDNFDGTEKIYINLTTPGCESNPIQS